MKFRPNSIRTQIALTLLIVMSSVFILLVYVASERLKVLPDIVINQYQEIASARANELGNEISGMQDHIEMIALSEVVETMVLEDIQSFLLSIARQGKFRNYTFSDMGGRAWATYDQFIDISSQEQFKEIIIYGRDAFMSRPFISPFIPERFPIITISHAIKNEGKTVGLVNGVVSTLFINDLLASITLPQDGFVWIVDDRGHVVAYPDSSISIDSTFEDITKLGFHEVSSDDHEPFFFIHDEVEFLSVHADIPNTRGWTLLICVNRNQAYGWVDLIVSTLYGAMALSLVILLTILLLSMNVVTTPIIKLKEAFEEAKLGNLNVRADESIQNEIGEAAKSFNAMLDQIRALTYKDPITGLNNFFSYLNEMPRVCEDYKDTNQRIFVVILSIDDFKRINSLYGYDIGNETLRVLSRIIQPYLKPREMIARYFGDEMIMSMIAVNQEEVIQRIMDVLLVLQRPLMVDNIEVHLEISSGIAHYDPEFSLSDVIRQATLAKHKAKADMSSRITVYSDFLYQDILKEQDLQEALQHSIERNELYLVYQSIHNISENKTVGYEALLRWNHPVYRNVPILDIIQMAERIGYIQDIGRFVLRQAAQKLKDLNQVNPNLSVSINVSALQLQNTKFIEYAGTLVDEIGFTASNLIVEITESATMLDVEDKKDILGQLKSLGFQVAIDDFGTGYSSLIYIAKLPLDMIKIDREFISKLEFDEYARVLIVSILSIAKTLNLRVVAEGVETIDQVKALEALGCQLIQGYYISKPKQL